MLSSFHLYSSLDTQAWTPRLTYSLSGHLLVSSFSSLWLWAPHEAGDYCHWGWSWHVFHVFILDIQKGLETTISDEKWENFIIIWFLTPFHMCYTHLITTKNVREIIPAFSKGRTNVGKNSAVLHFGNIIRFSEDFPSSQTGLSVFQNFSSSHRQETWQWVFP